MCARNIRQSEESLHMSVAARRGVCPVVFAVECVRLGLLVRAMRLFIVTR